MDAVADHNLWLCLKSNPNSLGNNNFLRDGLTYMNVQGRCYEAVRICCKVSIFYSGAGNLDSEEERGE